MLLQDLFLLFSDAASIIIHFFGPKIGWQVIPHIFWVEDALLVELDLFLVLVADIF